MSLFISLGKGRKGKSLDVRWQNTTCLPAGTSMKPTVKGSWPHQQGAERPQPCSEAEGTQGALSLQQPRLSNSLKATPRVGAAEGHPQQHQLQAAAILHASWCLQSWCLQKRNQKALLVIFLLHARGTSVGHGLLHPTRVEVEGEGKNNPTRIPVLQETASSPFRGETESHSRPAVTLNTRERAAIWAQIYRLCFLTCTSVFYK